MSEHGHVFEGKPDARQTDAQNVAPQHSLFRKRYRALSPGEIELHDLIKDTADALAALFLRVKTTNGMRDGAGNIVSPDVDRAIAHLEDAVYRAVKALTA